MLYQVMYFSKDIETKEYCCEFTYDIKSNKTIDEVQELIQLWNNKLTELNISGEFCINQLDEPDVLDENTFNKVLDIIKSL